MKKFIAATLFASAGVFTSACYAVSCSGLDNWSGTSVYHNGDQVQHNNNAYQANWWTQGQNPESHSSQWQEWTPLGQCDGGGDGGQNAAPTAAANGPYSASIGTPINFSSTGSADTDGTINTYLWSFGDGATSDEANPTHSYNSAGTYTVTLTVTDNNGASSTASSVATITSENNSGGNGGCAGLPTYVAGSSYAAGDHVVNLLEASGDTVEYVCEVAGWCSSTAAWAYEPGNGMHWEQAWSEVGTCGDGGGGNQKPVANANGPYSGAQGQSLSFSSGGSNDADGSIAGYSWNFGDGGTASTANPSHTYAQAGTYTVTLTVTDNEGASATDSTVANIANAGGNQPPSARANGPYSGTPGSSISFSSAGSDDPDGSIVGYAWNFGDGASSDQENPSHSYAAAGTYNVTLTVTDNDGATATATATVTLSGSGGGGGSGAKKVIGYFAQWGVYQRNYHVKNIVTSGSAEKLTHIVYAFGNVTGGRCVIGDAYADYDRFYNAGESVDGQADTWDAGALRGSFNQLRKLKQMYPHIKVLWSFGGWTWSGGFGEAAANPEAFADSCYDLLHDSRWDGVFDGIDIDWEYPNECGATCDSSGFDAYRNLMSALRARFGNELVTAAIGAGEAKLNAADYGGAAQYVDFYMLMTYDYFGAWAAQGPTAPHSPLHEFNGIPQAGFYAGHSLNVLKSKGVPANKILLGIGFYGRGWTGVLQGAPGGSASGPAHGTYEQGIEDYKVLKNSCPATGTIAGTAYAHCGNNWWSYDTPSTINGKMNYLKGQGLGGAFFWELSGDTANGELINAISNGL